MILFHLAPATPGNPCGTVTNCLEARTTGITGEPMFAYLLVARGDLPNVGGVELGISYGDGTIGSISDGKGVDIHEWTS
jgi:hypothetical protein